MAACQNACGPVDYLLCRFIADEKKNGCEAFGYQIHIQHLIQFASTEVFAPFLSILLDFRSFKTVFVIVEGNK